MVKKQGNEGFVCEKCGHEVMALTNGSYRNHCPVCLYSKHVDVVPGDRSNHCRGLMEPVGIRYNPKKGYQIIHRCLKCGEEKVNMVADNTLQRDSMDAILTLVG